MCSVSWVHTPGGYQLIFNRDERTARKPAAYPVEAISKDVRYLSPADGDFGGTWLAVNEFGLSLGLVNYYPEFQFQKPDFKKSRGFIVPAFIHLRDAKTAGYAIQILDPEPYEPFELLVFDGTTDGFIVRWDRREFSVRMLTFDENPLASSSFITAEVVAYRKSLFRSLMDSEVGESTALQFQFHTRLHHQNLAYNPCMFREDARTVSISIVDVAREEIRWDYHDLAGGAKPGDLVSTSRLSRAG